MVWKNEIREEEEMSSLEANDWFKLIVVIIITIVVVAIIGSTFAPSFSFISPENVEYKNHLTGLNLSTFESNKTFIQQLQITNTFNVSVKMYSFLYTEPENLDVEWSCSIANGTDLFEGQSLLATYELFVESHNFTYPEIYIRVGCLKAGEDY